MWGQAHHLASKDEVEVVTFSKETGSVSISQRGPSFRKSRWYVIRDVLISTKELISIIMRDIKKWEVDGNGCYNGFMLAPKRSALLKE